jgi:nitrite reductase/ring-hydroxylating ferredoxin subunit
LPDGKPVRVKAKGAPVMLLRDGDHIHAVGAKCTHLAGPMDEGEIDLDACTATCPWHASVFDMRDGSVVHGPATVSLPSYEVTVEQGRVLVRLEKRTALV